MGTEPHKGLLRGYATSISPPKNHVNSKIVDKIFKNLRYFFGNFRLTFFRLAESCV